MLAPVVLDPGAALAPDADGAAVARAAPSRTAVMAAVAAGAANSR
jgi:hypothetical protein